MKPTRWRRPQLAYQLLHRAASAVIEGERYRAPAATMVVHPFSTKRAGWSDYALFMSLFDVRAEIEKPQRLLSSVVPLFVLWVPGDPRFLVC